MVALSSGSTSFPKRSIDEGIPSNVGAKVSSSASEITRIHESHLMSLFSRMRSEGFSFNLGV